MMKPPPAEALAWFASLLDQHTGPLARSSAVMKAAAELTERNRPDRAGTRRQSPLGLRPPSRSPERPVPPAAAAQPRDFKPLFLTVPEACAILRIGRTRLYGEVKAGRLRLTKRGRSTRLSMHELERYASELSR